MLMLSYRIWPEVGTAIAERNQRDEDAGRAANEEKAPKRRRRPAPTRPSRPTLIDVACQPCGACDNVVPFDVFVGGRNERVERVAQCHVVVHL